MYKKIFLDLRERIFDYAHHLTIYDYFAYSWVLITFVFLIIFVFILMKKSPKIAILLFFIASLFLMFSPIFVKIIFDKSIKKVEIIDKDIKKLNFSHMLIIQGKIKNKAKIDFDKCRVFAFVIKKSDNKYKQFLNHLKFKRYLSIVINKQLKRGESLPFKLIFKEFYEDSYITKIYGECY